MSMTKRHLEKIEDFTGKELTFNGCGEEQAIKELCLNIAMISGVNPIDIFDFVVDDKNYIYGINYNKPTVTEKAENMREHAPAAV